MAEIAPFYGIDLPSLKELLIGEVNEGESDREGTWSFYYSKQLTLSSLPSLEIVIIGNHAFNRFYGTTSFACERRVWLMTYRPAAVVLHPAGQSRLRGSERERAEVVELRAAEHGGGGHGCLQLRSHRDDCE